jgi:hypothetical protein
MWHDHMCQFEAYEGRFDGLPAGFPGRRPGGPASRGPTRVPPAPPQAARTGRRPSRRWLQSPDRRGEAVGVSVRAGWLTMDSATSLRNRALSLASLLAFHTKALRRLGWAVCMFGQQVTAVARPMWSSRSSREQRRIADSPRMAHSCDRRTAVDRCVPCFRPDLGQTRHDAEGGPRGPPGRGLRTPAAGRSR